MSEQLIVYTSSAIQCPYCVRAKQTLSDHDYLFEERDVADPAIRRELLERHPAARTVPQIFLNSGYYIGGCDDLVLLIEQDRLAPLIESIHGPE